MNPLKTALLPVSIVLLVMSAAIFHSRSSAFEHPHTVQDPAYDQMNSPRLYQLAAEAWERGELETAFYLNALSANRAAVDRLFFTSEAETMPAPPSGELSRAMIIAMAFKPDLVEAQVLAAEQTPLGIPDSYNPGWNARAIGTADEYRQFATEFARLETAELRILLSQFRSEPLGPTATALFSNLADPAMIRKIQGAEFQPAQELSDAQKIELGEQFGQQQAEFMQSIEDVVQSRYRDRLRLVARIKQLAASKGITITYNELNEEEQRVILNKGTEFAFAGQYTDNKDAGTYICRQCNAPLYRSTDKFESDCGWPSFDDEIEGSVRREVDADGYRTEIVCGNCNGHLGHVFEGERMTEKNTRHCVNSVSMSFIPQGEELPAKLSGVTGDAWGESDR